MQPNLLQSFLFFFRKKGGGKLKGKALRLETKGGILLRMRPELSRECKRPRLYFGENMFPANPNYTRKTAASFDGIVDYSDPFSLRNLIEFLESGKYGSVTQDIESLCARRDEMLKLLCVNYPSCHDRINYYPSQCHIADKEEGHDSAYGNIYSVGGDSGTKYDNLPIIDIDSDDEHGKIQGEIQPATYLLSESTNPSSTPFMLKQFLDNAPETDPLQKLNMKNHILSSAQWNSSYLYQKVVLGNNSSVAASKEKYLRCSDSGEQKDKICDGEKVEEDNVKDGVTSKLLIPNDVGLMEETCKNCSDEDGLQDMWREMNLALECSKGADLDNLVNIKNAESECEHSCVLKDDLGYVCQLCGVIQKSIEALIDYQWKKETRSTRTYASELRSGKATDEIDVSSFSGIGDITHDFTCEVSIHPRHRKQMKPHQFEGFKFLVKNLVAENPGGCILAHAPGSGKTFLIISFIQSFLAKFPLAKPMVVLPKGILSTWKKEFQRWQIEDVPLFDLYLASNRAQQLEVLNNWLNQKSVLFLGYKQFSSILCETATNTVEAECQEKLLKVPSLLILDEGHTPRNENTNVLYTLSKVHTPRKVVLSGTIFQNHVKEVFNILNLVRPKFLKTDDCRAIVKRILSKVQISGGSRKFVKIGTNTAFFDLVEETLQKDEDFKRKAAVINDLREMTCNVLHYYKGDFLEELPGLVDFTVVLKLTDKQKNLIEGLKKLEKFKRISVGSAVYMHPELKDVSEKYTGEKGSYLLGDDKLDLMIDKINLKDGVKTRFFLKVLSLAESANEKVLVFSQYLLPLKFLERILAIVRGWTLGKEMFIISGDSSPEDRETSMDKFNTSSDSRVLFGSIKACGEGISLVGASRIIILDVHLNPSVTRQAIGRAFRPGQLKKVYTYRLVAADSPEEKDHQTSFCKDLISKLWFEWSQFSGTHDFAIEEVETDSCGDMFIESPNIREDVKVLYRR